VHHPTNISAPHPPLTAAPDEPICSAIDHKKGACDLRSLRDALNIDGTVRFPSAVRLNVDIHGVALKGAEILAARGVTRSSFG
jgi:hypothetical protein